MDTIYLSEKNLACDEIVNKKRIIITNGTHVLAYKFSNRRVVKYRFPGVTDKDFNTLFEKINNITDLNLKEDDMVELIRTIQYSTIFNSENNKLIPILRKVVRDYYVYYHEFDDQFLNQICTTNEDDWFMEPKILKIADILNPVNMILKNPFAKIGLPTYELQKRLKYEKY